MLQVRVNHEVPYFYGHVMIGTLSLVPRTKITQWFKPFLYFLLEKLLPQTWSQSTSFQQIISAFQKHFGIRQPSFKLEGPEVISHI